MDRFLKMADRIFRIFRDKKPFFIPQKRRHEPALLKRLDRIISSRARKLGLFCNLLDARRTQAQTRKINLRLCWSEPKGCEKLRNVCGHSLTIVPYFPAEPPCLLAGRDPAPRDFVIPTVRSNSFTRNDSTTAGFSPLVRRSSASVPERSAS